MRGARPARLARAGDGDLSGGEAARAALAAILLSRFDVLLLDEPTNDLDFDGLDRLERFVDGFAGGLAVVSHDRAFLDRTVTRIAEIDPWTARCASTPAAGASSGGARLRGERQYGAFERCAGATPRDRGAPARAPQSGARRRRSHDATAARDARAVQGAPGASGAGAGRAASRSRTSRGSCSSRSAAAQRPGDRVASLEGAVGERGTFRLGPIDLDLAPGERVAVTGRNGSGKTTLLALLLGELPLAAGTARRPRDRDRGRSTSAARAYDGDEPLLATFTARTGLPREDARTLLAKFDLGADHVERPCATLSPGERTRAQLAELMARGVNLLVLDEPTNHLDLEAIEELETALAAYDGTLVVVSHDRRFLEAVAPTRSIDL